MSNDSLHQPLPGETGRVSDGDPSRPATAEVHVQIGFGALSGLLAAGLGLAMGEFVAGFAAEARSPIAVIGDRIIDLVPVAIERWAISLFGTNDKTVLLIGIAVALIVLASSVGVRALRSTRATGGVVAGLVVGLVGMMAALTGRQGGFTSALPSMAAGLVSAGVLWLFHRKVHGPTNSTTALAFEGAMDRRRFLTASAVVGASAVGLGGLGRLMQSRFRIAGERAALVFPAARRRLAPPPVDPALEIEDLSPLITPTNRFYRIDTAFVTPRVSVDDWTLEVTGMVNKPLSLRFDDLLSRPLIETDVTIACVSNEVGGDLVGNARWLGVRLDDLLDEVGIHPEADQIVGRSVEGWTGGFPVEVLDGRDCIIAVGMNGEPLTSTHGYPARLIIPGLYGYVSATKWLSEIELTRFDQFEGYWVPRGWSALGPIKTQSRIDTPRSAQTIDAGITAIAGVAWSPLHGIKGVDVRVDDGPWEPATLGPELATTTWRQWWLSWEPTPGNHVVHCRAIDGTGAAQTEKRQDVLPDGATGLHSINVSVRS